MMTVFDNFVIFVKLLITGMVLTWAAAQSALAGTSIMVAYLSA